MSILWNLEQRIKHSEMYRTFSRRALGTPLSIVEIGDVGSEIMLAGFVGVVGTSDWLDSSLTVCSAFSIRRLQLNRFLAFSETIKVAMCQKLSFTSLETTICKKKFLRLEQQLMTFKAGSWNYLWFNWMALDMSEDACT